MSKCMAYNRLPPQRADSSQLTLGTFHAPFWPSAAQAVATRTCDSALARRRCFVARRRRPRWGAGANRRRRRFLCGQFRLSKTRPIEPLLGPFLIIIVFLVVAVVIAIFYFQLQFSSSITVKVLCGFLYSICLKIYGKFMA